jgi:hypothetical protein
VEVLVLTTPLEVLVDQAVAVVVVQRRDLELQGKVIMVALVLTIQEFLLVQVVEVEALGQ